MDDKMIADTPGLNDIQNGRRAAEEISKGLKSGGCYKIFFFITLRGGHVAPEDPWVQGLHQQRSFSSASCRKCERHRIARLARASREKGSRTRGVEKRYTEASKDP
jgi:hypothetical protein